MQIHLKKAVERLACKLNPALVSQITAIAVVVIYSITWLKGAEGAKFIHQQGNKRLRLLIKLRHGMAQGQSLAIGHLFFFADIL